MRQAAGRRRAARAGHTLLTAIALMVAIFGAYCWFDWYQTHGYKERVRPLYTAMMEIKAEYDGVDKGGKRYTEVFDGCAQMKQQMQGLQATLAAHECPNGQSRQIQSALGRLIELQMAMIDSTVAMYQAELEEKTIMKYLNQILYNPTLNNSYVGGMTQKVVSDGKAKAEQAARLYSEAKTRSEALRTEYEEQAGVVRELLGVDSE